MKQTSSSKEHSVPYKINPKTPISRHITIKRAKIKDKGGILKATREKQFVTCKGTSLRLNALIFQQKVAG